MCKGRSYNCISWLEQSFSFGMLISLASNKLLPSLVRAACIDFCLALYVDRNPQVPNCGAPKLPQQLWLYDDPSAAKGRLSSTPLILPICLTDEHAFPSFFVSKLSACEADPNPVISFPTASKFYLLRMLCLDIVSSLVGDSGGLVHGQAALNELGAAAIRCQQALVDFGFQSTAVTIQDLVVTNAVILDGKREDKTKGYPFNPARKRYLEIAGQSDTVTAMKRSVIGAHLFTKSHY